MIFYCCDYNSVLIAVKVAKIENKSKHPPPQNADAVTFTPEPAYGHRTHNVYMMTHTVAYFFFLGGEKNLPKSPFWQGAQNHAPAATRVMWLRAQDYGAHGHKGR